MDLPASTPAQSSSGDRIYGLADDAITPPGARREAPAPAGPPPTTNGPAPLASPTPAPPAASAAGPHAVGDTSAASPGGGGGFSRGVGTGPPSATPVVGGRGSGTARVGEGTSLPSVKVVGALSGLAMLPAAPGRDLGGGGMIAG